MNIKKYLIVTGTSVVILASAFSLVFADSQATFTFKNNTGGQVDDLHIKFNTAVNVTDDGPFSNVQDNNTSKPTLDGGTVANGGSATVKVTGQAGKTKVTKWWWTRGGNRVGPIHHGCKAPDCTSP